MMPASQIATKEMITVEDMIRVVTQLRSDFDYILIDSPAGIESGFRNAVAASDSAVVITNPEFTAVSDADRVLGLLENTHMGLDNVQFILNRYRENVSEKRGMLSIDEVINTLAVPLIGIVPDNEDIFIGTNRGVPIAFEPGHEMNTIFTNVVRRMIGQNIPIDSDLRLAKPTLWRLFVRLFKG